ncbi:unnamed protein product [Penicillium olsonii]|nr:unnamed protein product [Penicillium olsonii]
MADFPLPHNVIAHLPPSGLIGIAWGGASLGIVFTSARLLVRVKYMKRLLADDYFMLFALVLLVTNAILHTLQTPHLYYLGLHPTGSDIEYHVLRYLCYEFAMSGIFWTILWSVKGSFLALFWMVSDGLPVYRRVWWAVVVFSCLGYIGCWVVLVYTCHPPSSYFKYGEGQCGKPVDFNGFTIAISYSTAVDILTDLLAVVVGSLPPFRAVISSPKSTLQSPHGSSGVKPQSYDRNNSAHGKSPLMQTGWGHSPPPSHSCRIYHNQGDGMRSSDIHILEDNVALSLDRVYPTLSRELLARKIKVEQDFSVISSV